MELSEAEKQLFASAQLTGARTPNFRHGKYLLMLDTWKLHRGYRGVLSDVHNFVVMKSSPVTVMQDGPVTEIPNEVGTTAGAVYKYEGPGAEMASINSMRFLLTLFGLSERDIPPQDRVAAWQRATNEDPRQFQNDRLDGTDTIIPSVNPCRGMLIGMETTPILTKKSKTWIVGLNWRHIAPPGSGENSYEAAAQRWAEYQQKYHR